MEFEIIHEAADASLVLLAHDGAILGGPVPIAHGERLDLLQAMPALKTLDQAAYLQLLHGSRPIGPADVIEPALSRRIPIVETVETPERGTWTRIIGWQDEGAIDNDKLPQGAGRIDGAALKAAVARDESVVRSGFWVYIEMDLAWKTSHGDLLIDLREDTAPLTCRNFRRLTNKNFLNGTIMHRIIPVGRNGRPFVIQGGDPTGTGEGGPGWWVPMEPSFLGHDYGVLSMARADDPDSAGSQWFIALDAQETARLDGQYCAFGEVIDGAPAIDAMARVELADNDYGSSRPVDPPVLLDARVVAAPPRSPGTGRPDARVKSSHPRDPS
jgi:cyclophilin family peptidyl-prolyl cis-trans isomerase